VIADSDNDSRHVAVDLLAQAEHDEAAQAILITDNLAFADAVVAAVAAELPTLPRVAIAGASWRGHGAVIVVRDWAEAGRSATGWRPSTCNLWSRIPLRCFARIRHAGAAFLGRFAPRRLAITSPPEPRAADRPQRPLRLGLSVFDFLSAPPG